MGLCNSSILLSHKIGRSPKLSLYLTGYSKDTRVCGSNPNSGKGISHIPAVSAKRSVTEVVCGSIPSLLLELLQVEIL